MNHTTVQMRKKGSLTLPVELRSEYNLKEGDVFTLIDLGDGSFLLTPRVSQVERLGDTIPKLVAEAGVNAEELIHALDEEREQYYLEHYADD
jgi:bifunctional DNA-binding transcriptional regulator/antitoxin component of YhaV-PrlF toxin-antitoxin module